MKYFYYTKNTNNNIISICIDHSDFNIHILTLDCFENKDIFIELLSFHPTIYQQGTWLQVPNPQRPRPCSHIDMAVRA